MNPPTEIMLQWTNGSWDHRAYWGANVIDYGTDGSTSRRYMGPLPLAGRWVRLEVPASSVGLAGTTLKGMSFTSYGGKVTWDCAGKNAPFTVSTPRSANGVVLSWNSLPGQKYDIAYRSSLGGTNWITVSPTITATKYTCTWTDTSIGSNTQRFYRIIAK